MKFLANQVDRSKRKEHFFNAVDYNKCIIAILVDCAQHFPICWMSAGRLPVADQFQDLEITIIAI